MAARSAGCLAAQHELRAGLVLPAGRDQFVQDFQRPVGVRHRHQQVVMVEAGQDVAADLRLGQGGADGGRQADRLQRRVHLEGDPGADEVVGQPQAVRFVPRQHHGQPLGLADGGRDGPGQGLAVRPQDVDVFALAQFGVHGGQQGVEVLFSCHGASLGGGPAPVRSRRPGGCRHTKTAAAPPEGNSRRRRLAVRLLGVGRDSFLGVDAWQCRLAVPASRRRSWLRPQAAAGAAAGFGAGVAAATKAPRGLSRSISCVVSRPRKKAQDPAEDHADLALHGGHGHAVVATVCQPGQRALEADAAEQVDVGNALPFAEAGDGAQVLVLVVLERLVPAGGPQVLGEALGLAQRVLGVRHAGAVRQAAAREVGDGSDVAGGPGVLDDALVACDAQVGQDADAAARLEREVGGADHRVGLHTGSPDQGVGLEFLGQASCPGG